MLISQFTEHIVTLDYITCINIAIHCKWGAWVYGICSASCGTGTRTDTRVKIVEEANGGTCTGKPIEIVQCKEKECPGKYLVSKYTRQRMYV